jgi:hypothetical protein
LIPHWFLADSVNVFRTAFSEMNTKLEIRFHAAEEVGPTLRLTQRALDALFVHRPTGFDNAYKGRVPVIGLQVDIYPSGLGRSRTIRTRYAGPV